MSFRLLSILVVAVIGAASAAPPLPAGAAPNLSGSSLLPSGAAAAIAAPGADDRENQQVLTRYFDVSKKNIVRGASMAAKFVGKLPKLGREATIEARRFINPDGGVEYEVLARDGDKTVQKDLIARYMGAEMEASTRSNSDVAINPENYKFKVKGIHERGGQTVQVVEVNPRKKRAGLFKGELWLEPETGLTLCETGRFVKSPSVFLKKVEFARTFQIVDGISVPKGMKTKIQTRLWGQAELIVEFSDLKRDTLTSSR